MRHPGESGLDLKPCPQRNCSKAEFHHDARRTHARPIPAVTECVGRRGVGVRHGREKHQRHAHLVHFSAPSAHCERVRELVQPLDDRVANPREHEVVRGPHVFRSVCVQVAPVLACCNRRQAHCSYPEHQRRGAQQRPQRRLQAIEQSRRVKKRHGKRKRVHPRAPAARPLLVLTKEPGDIRHRLELHEFSSRPVATGGAPPPPASAHRRRIFRAAASIPG